MRLMRLVVAACALALAGAARAAPAYRPPVEPAPASKPQAFFGKDIGSGKWCVFDQRAFEAKSRLDQLEADESGWARFSPGRLESVTVLSQSEDAVARDEYTFLADGRVARLVRTGGYINSPAASLTYLPGPSGRLALTPASRQVVRRLDAAGFEHYIEDWPTYARLSQLPFAQFLDIKAGLRGKPGSCAL